MKNCLILKIYETTSNVERLTDKQIFIFPSISNNTEELKMLNSTQLS
jgi:hypothetical protein